MPYLPPGRRPKPGCRANCLPTRVALATSVLVLAWGWPAQSQPRGADPRSGSPPAEPLYPLRVSDDGRGFVTLLPSGERRPTDLRGFNYDHDRQGRLIEDYWLDEWPTVEADFQEMRDLGASAVRIHLQLGRFLPRPDEPDPRHLGQLSRLLELAERTGLYLDLTGLGCYHRADVPAWYDQLDEAGRWQVQCRFWEELARACRGSPAVWCFDLMNEPVVSGGRRENGDWLGPPFAGKHFVQFITLDTAGRARPDVARAWVAQLCGAIRRHDPERLITVGLVDWSLDRPGLSSGFVPQAVAGPLDFLCVHHYPESGQVAEGLKTLAGFQVGKPLVLEETFPLRCSLNELEEFLGGAEPELAGWLGFYWGQTASECRQGGTLAEAITAAWLEWFQRRTRN